MREHERLIKDLADYYNHYSKYQCKKCATGGSILDGVKSFFKTVYNVGDNILHSDKLKNVVKNCIKSVVKGAGSKMSPPNEEEMLMDLANIINKYKGTKDEITGGILPLIALIISMGSSMALQLSPYAIKAVKNCVKGSILGSGKKGGVIPVRYDESNFKSSFQADDEPIKYHKQPRVVGGKKKGPNKWLQFTKTLKKNDKPKLYPGNGNHYIRSENGKIQKV